MRRPGQKNKTAFCPFCKERIDRPETIPSTPRREFPGGRCDCGTVFVSDITGKNGGEALLESLSLACNDDMDRAFSLQEGEDYKLKVMSYDDHTHTFNKSGYFKDGMARLYFVKIKD